MKAASTNSSGRQPPPRSCRELHVRALALEGCTVGRLAAALQRTVPSESRHAKGFVGQLVELALGADPQAGVRPDFPDLGVELKTIPVDDAQKPLESTFCCSIHMADADLQRWETSRLRQRLAHVLWLPIVAKRHGPVAARRFGKACLWIPTAAQQSLLQADWELLMGAIGAGRGATLTAREGAVLQVRPKAANAAVRTLAPGPDGPQTMLPLGFYLRPTFTAQLLKGTL